MDTIEKTLKYYPLVMKYDDTCKYGNDSNGVRLEEDRVIKIG